MALASLVVLFLVAIAATSAQLSGFWGNDDLESIQKKSHDLAANSKAIKDIYYSLQFLKQFEFVDSACNCKHIVSVANSDLSTALHVSYAMRAADLCGCPFTPPDAAVQVVRSSLQGDSVSVLAGGILAASRIDQFSDEDRLRAFHRLQPLIVDDNNSLKMLSRDNTLAQVADLHSVLDALALLSKDDELVAATSKDFLESYLDFLPGGRDDQVSDVTLLMPLRRLSDKRLRLLPAALAACGEALVSLRHHTGDAQMVFHAYEAAVYVSSLKNAPMHVSLDRSMFAAGSPVQARVVVHDLLGKVLVVESLEVAHVKAIGKDSTLAQGLAVNGDLLDLSQEVLSVGRYHVNLKANVKDKSAGAMLQTYLTVTETAQVVNLRAGVSKSMDEQNLESVLPSSFRGRASGDELDVLHVSYQVTGTSKRPHQCFVRLTLIEGKEKGFSVYFLSSRHGDGLDYSSSIAMGEELVRFQQLSGVYELAVLVSDAAYGEPVEVVLGQVTLSFPAKTPVTYPLYAKSLLHTSDTTLEALPEIQHVMRPPAKRASALMSTLFTAMVWVPLVVFVGFVLSLRPNLSRLRAVSSLALVGVLGAILVLYSGYWLTWPGFDFYSTIKYICVLIPAYLLVSRFALEAVMNKRHSEHSKKEKEA